MKIFAISGLGANKRVFKYLKLNLQIVLIEWINPLKNKKNDDYAKRLIEANKINKMIVF